jgi:ribulose-phosphate 3-epimerase
MNIHSQPLMNASLMCADPLNVGAEIDALNVAGIDMFHCDIMDGVFVPNVTLGLYQVASIVGASDVPVEAHLMVSRPEDFIDPLVQAGVKFITVHAESTQHLSRLLHRIRDAGVGAGLSLNPATPIGSADDVIHLVDLLQVMTVDPGFAGQAFLERGVERVTQARELLEASGRTQTILQVDGSINGATIPAVVRAGATSLVLGSSSLFGVPLAEYTSQLKKIREVADVRIAS